MIERSDLAVRISIQAGGAIDVWSLMMASPSMESRLVVPLVDCQLLAR